MCLHICIRSAHSRESAGCGTLPPTTPTRTGCRGNLAYACVHVHTTGKKSPSNLIYSYGGIKSIVFALLTLIGLIGGFFNPFSTMYYVALLCVRD